MKNKIDSINNYLAIALVIVILFGILTAMYLIEPNKDIIKTEDNSLYVKLYNETYNRIESFAHTCYEKGDIIYESNSSDNNVEVRTCKNEQGDYKIVIIDFNKVPGDITLKLSEEIKYLRNLETNETYFPEDNEITVPLIPYSVIYLEYNPSDILHYSWNNTSYLGNLEENECVEVTNEDIIIHPNYCDFDCIDQCMFPNTVECLTTCTIKPLSSEKIKKEYYSSLTKYDSQNWSFTENQTKIVIVNDIPEWLKD